MKYSVVFFVVHTLALLARADDVDDIYNAIQNNQKVVQSYQAPVDNSALFTVSNDTVVDQGDYDFIIVGGGTAGTLLAHKLSDVYAWRILVLEAGGHTTTITEIPQTIASLRRTDMNWGYLSTPQTTCCQGMVNKQCLYPRGKVIGGTSVIDAGVYARGHPSDYNAWAANGNSDWSFNNVFPYFLKSEIVALDKYDIGYHGQSGYLYVNQTAPPSVVAETFCNANLEKGLRDVDYNGRQQIGVSRIQFSIKGRKKQNSPRAFLDEVWLRFNIAILTNAAVNKLIMERDRVRGVTFIKDGTLHTAQARLEVILSAGAINTPQLLMVNGIGPKADLQKLGIKVINDLPLVGKNLQDHPMFANLYFRTNLTAENRTLRENVELYVKGEGPLTNGAGLEQVVFINSKKIVNGAPDVELLTFAPPFSVPPNPKFGFNFDDTNSAVYKNYNPLTDISILVAAMKPKSRGQVTLKSGNIVDFPLIDLQYFSDAKGEDIETMYKGIKYALSLLNTKAFKKVNATLISTQPNCENLKNGTSDKDYWYCAIRNMASTEYHASGTTKMGWSPFDSVVNYNLIVHNTQNLRVVDAGVIPEIPRGHLDATVYMIAEKIAEKIKVQYGKSCCKRY